MTTPKTGAPEWTASQASPNTTVNEQARRIESGAGFYQVVDKDLTTPPGSCADGATYIVAGGGGAWVGHIGDIAIAVGVDAGSGWYFRDQEEGLFAWVQDEDTLYRCTTSSSPGTWTAFNSGATTLDGLTDVDVPSPTDGQVLTYDTTSPAGWKAETPAAVVTTLDGLSDVDTSSSPAPASTDLLAFDGSLWRPESPTQMIDRLVGGAAQGDILYRNGTVWTRLGAGTSGQVLQTNGAAANPSWVTPSGGSVGSAGIVLLATATPSGTGTVSFTSISGSYSHLKIVGGGASTVVANNTSLALQLNGDSGANYEWQRHYAAGTGGGNASESLTPTSIEIGAVTGSTGIASDAGSFEVLIPNYAGSTFKKNLISHSLLRTATSSGGVLLFNYDGWWNNTAAITRVDIFVGSGNWVSGSKISLYGLL